MASIIGGSADIKKTSYLRNSTWIEAFKDKYNSSIDIEDIDFCARVSIDIDRYFDSTLFHEVTRREQGVGETGKPLN